MSKSNVVQKSKKERNHNVSLVQIDHCIFHWIYFAIYPIFLEAIIDDCKMDHFEKLTHKLPLEADDSHYYDLIERFHLGAKVFVPSNAY